MKNLSMKNAQHTSIPERMSSGSGFRGEDHDVTVGTRIHGVLIPADIIRREVNAEDLSGINAIVYDAQCIVIGVREAVFISIVLHMENT